YRSFFLLLFFFLLLLSFFFFKILPPPRSTLFPYTTLFRSHVSHRLDDELQRRSLPLAAVAGVQPARHHQLLRAGRLACARYQRRSEEHTSELQSPCNLVCRLLLEKKKKKKNQLNKLN